jgi:hypothetical protein
VDSRLSPQQLQPAPVRESLLSMRCGQERTWSRGPNTHIDLRRPGTLVIDTHLSSTCGGGEEGTHCIASFRPMVLRKLTIHCLQPSSHVLCIASSHAVSPGSRPRITWLDTMRFTVVYNSLQQFITWLDYTIRWHPAIYPAGNGGSRPRITWLDYMAVYRGVPPCILHGTRQSTRYPAMLHRSRHVMAGGPEGSDGIW